MKAALILLVFGVCVTLSLGIKNCWFKPEDCTEDECCIRLSNLIGICKKLKQEDERCSTKELKQPFKDHVYLMQCPCKEGLTCEKKDGLIGNFLGTCTVGSGEVPEGNGGGDE